MAKPKNIFPRDIFELLPQMFFSYKALGEVVTKSEAAHLWGKAESTIEMQIAKGRLQARTTLTGGAVLITVQSLKKLWGEPISRALLWAGGETNELDYEGNGD